MNPTHAPAATPRHPAPDQEPAAEETLAAHAKRALRSQVRARITAVLDAGIASLQGLRTKIGGAPVVEEDEEGPWSRRDRLRERRSAAAPEAPPAAPVPKPRRRLRAFLVYISVMLIGGLAGGALAYTQFQKQLDRQLKDSQRLQAELAKKTRPGAEIQEAFENEQARRTQAEQKLAASLAEYAESAGHSYALLEKFYGEQLAENRRLETALAENARASAETRKTLAEAQAWRSKAEEKFAEYSTSLIEKQRQLEATEKQLDSLLDDAAPRSGERHPPPRPRTASSRPGSLKSGNCTLDAQSVSALKGCLEDFNR